jgi:hypothetical protein
MQPGLKNFTFPFSELDITTGLVEEAMGYCKGQSPEPFPDMIALELNQCEGLCNIRGSLLVSDNFSLDPAGITEVNGVKFNIGKKIAQQLRKAKGVALFLCTAGSGICDKSKELMEKGNMIEGYILDVIGSVTVEAAIDKIQDSFEYELVCKGFKMANRYSPGYCGWSLTEQKQLFELFPNNNCGIKLSGSCLMDPIKSVSGIIGFGTDITKTACECQMCELETCLYRAIRLARGK